jgi:acyl-[acyl-carrier-protein]-phospholipid O-acyltransferase/long-chain-fatty-acid--[acyl-carrier-protein] ligase
VNRGPARGGPYRGRPRTATPTDRRDAQRSVLADAARAAGLPELFVPRTITVVATVPLLGSGKVDYAGVGQLATELARAS